MASLPGQVRAAAAVAAAVPAPSLPDPGEVEHVLFCGMGGSAAGGEVLAAVASVPVVVHRSWDLPGWCGSRTFVVASSYSGETAEVLSAFREARERGARGLAVTSGGTLADEAERAGWAVARAEDGLMPRYALGWASVLPAAVCERAGLARLAPGWADALPVALERRLGAWGPATVAQDNVAKGLAHALDGVMPVVWGGGPAAGAAAQRWKNDLNENAKVFAHAAAFPEGAHNELVGWAAEGRDGRPPVPRALIRLRESVEDERLAHTLDAAVREAAGDFSLVWEATGEGDDALQRFLDLSLLGGFVSVYLAILRGVDPTPIEAIGRLKAAPAR